MCTAETINPPAGGPGDSTRRRLRADGSTLISGQISEGAAKSFGLPLITVITPASNNTCRRQGPVAASPSITEQDKHVVRLISASIRRNCCSSFGVVPLIETAEGDGDGSGPIDR